jgi:hypothetical protein
MNSFNKILYTLGLASVIAIVPAEAQSILPTGAQPMIVTPHNQSVSYSERTLCLNVEANVDYEVTSDASWVTIRRSSGNRVYLHVDTNYDGETRTANITFANSEKSISQTLVITQAADGSVETIPTDNRIYPSTASASSYALSLVLFGRRFGEQPRDADLQLQKRRLHQLRHLCAA